MISLVRLLSVGVNGKNGYSWTFAQLALRRPPQCCPCGVLNGWPTGCGGLYWNPGVEGRASLGHRLQEHDRDGGSKTTRDRAERTTIHCTFRVPGARTHGYNYLETRASGGAVQRGVGCSGIVPTLEFNLAGSLGTQSPRPFFRHEIRGDLPAREFLEPMQAK